MQTKNFRSKGFQKIDKVIRQTAKTKGLENALYRHKALKSWQDVACSFVEPAKHLTRALDLKQGVLTVACLSREVATQIRMLASRIIEALNQILGRPMVYAIYLEV